MKIAVIIPAYKVKQQILSVIKAIDSSIAFIIVVDDKCPENTGQFVEQEITDKRLTVLYHDKNKGVGGAMKTGFKKAMELSADIVVKVDGDGQMDVSFIATLTAPILNGKSDFTKGNRFFFLSELTKMPFTRLMGNSILSLFNKLVNGYWNIMDPTNGYTAITKKAIKLLEYRSIDKRYFFETSMLINLNIMNLVVKDVPIPAKYGDEESNLSIFKSAVEFPRKLLKGFLKRIFYRYFLYDFNMGSIYLILGLPMFLFGVIFGGYRWYLSAVYDIANPIGTVMLVALSTILGVQFLVGGVGVDMSNIPKETTL